MAKLRKTRAQKEAATEKRQQFTYSFNPKISPAPVHNKPVIAHKLSAITTAHVKNDLQKTLFTSLFLIAMQIILLSLLQHHIVKIPGASY